MGAGDPGSIAGLNFPERQLGTGASGAGALESRTGYLERGKGIGLALGYVSTQICKGS